MNIFIAGIVYGSLVDGNGLRTTVFLSGCSIKCKGCHNQEFWDQKKGKIYQTDVLVEEIVKNTPQKKLTISGGEPLEQKDALIDLLEKLQGFNIGLYTSFDIQEIDEKILNKVQFVKTGKYIQDLRIEDQYFGSRNQKIIYLENQNAQRQHQ